MALYFPTRLASDNASDNLGLQMISNSCCRETLLVFTGMDHVLSGRHPTRRTGAHRVSSAARSNTKALSEIIVGSGSEMVTRNYSLCRCVTLLPLADLPGEELEYEAGKSMRH